MLGEKEKPGQGGGVRRVGGQERPHCEGEGVNMPVSGGLPSAQRACAGRIPGMFVEEQGHQHA